MDCAEDADEEVVFAACAAAAAATADEIASGAAASMCFAGGVEPPDAGGTDPVEPELDPTSCRRV